MFDGDNAEDPPVGSIANILGDLKTTLEATGCSLADLGADTLRAYDIVEDKTRSDALFEEALSGYPESHTKAVLNSELPKYSAVKSAEPTQ